MQMLHGRFGVGSAAGHGVASLDGALALKVRVEVDGEAYRGVVAADTWAGWVDVLKRDDRGSLLLIDRRPQLQRYHGRVVARLIQGTQADVDQLTKAGLALG